MWIQPSYWPVKTSLMSFRWSPHIFFAAILPKCKNCVAQRCICLNIYPFQWAFQFMPDMEHHSIGCFFLEGNPKQFDGKSHGFLYFLPSKTNPFIIRFGTRMSIHIVRGFSKYSQMMLDMIWGSIIIITHESVVNYPTVSEKKWIITFSAT